MIPCIEWQGPVAPNGYGRKYDLNKQGWEFVHRLALGAKKGEVVMHSCDNRLCMNRQHLRISTQSDNILDAVQKGRHYNSKKTHCIRGHELQGKSLYVLPDGRRQCRMCARLRGH